MEEIKKIIKKIKSVISELLKNPFDVENKIILLVSFILSFVLIFIITFPYSNFIEKQIDSIAKKTFKQFSMSGTKFFLINPVYAENLVIVFKNNNKVELDKTKIKFSVVKYFLSKNINVKLSANSINAAFVKMEISSKINDLKIKMDKDEKTNALNGSISFKLSDSILKNVDFSTLGFSGFEFEKININQILSELEIQNSKISFKKFEFKGNDLSGKITGDIKLTKKINSSSLNLIIEVDSRSNVMKDFQGFLTSYINKDTNRLKIVLTGNLGRPSINFKR